MPKGFLVRRRRDHISRRYRYEREDSENTVPGQTDVGASSVYSPLWCTTQPGESFVAHHAVITELTPPSSPCPSLATLLSGPPVFRLPVPTAMPPCDVLRDSSCVASSPARVLTVANRPRSTGGAAKRSTKKAPAGADVRGDIEPSLNVVAVTSEALAELRRIENRLGAYICRLCQRHFDDAFLLAKHRCAKIVRRDFPCADCDKVFSYAAHLASHRRWHRLRPTPGQTHATTPASAPRGIR